VLVSRWRARLQNEQLRLDAKMPATVIAQRIGWTRSLTILKDRIRQIRPEYLGVDPADRIGWTGRAGPAPTVSPPRRPANAGG
jgi:hypothetical protein